MHGVSERQLVSQPAEVGDTRLSSSIDSIDEQWAELRRKYFHEVSSTNIGSVASR